MKIGSHVGFKSDSQLIGSVKESLLYGSNTFMFYTGAPQNTNRKEINDDLTLEAIKLMKENNMDINDVIVHAPYIINMANKKNEDFNVSFLKQEINRVEKLGVSKLVIHPGSHVGYGIDEGIKNIVECLNKVLTNDTKVQILLETMAGKGTEIGSKIEELKKIIENTVHSEKLGICIDTCHMHDAGYDVSDFNKILNEIDLEIGLNKLGCIHVNDSKNIISSHKDRHANIGFGFIGFDNIINIIYNDKLKDITKILETPYVSISDDKIYPPYKFEIEMIKNKKFNENLIDEIEKYYD